MQRAWVCVLPMRFLIFVIWCNMETWTSNSHQRKEPISDVIISVTGEMYNLRTRTCYEKWLRDEVDNITNQLHLIRTITVQVPLSHHIGLMLITSSLLQFFVFLFWFWFLQVYYANLFTNYSRRESVAEPSWLKTYFPNLLLNSWQMIWYLRKLSKKSHIQIVIIISFSLTTKT